MWLFFDLNFLFSQTANWNANIKLGKWSMYQPQIEGIYLEDMSFYF